MPISPRIGERTSPAFKRRTFPGDTYKDVKLEAKLADSELALVFIIERRLPAKLVAWKRQNVEPLVLVLIVQRP